MAHALHFDGTDTSGANYNAMVETPELPILPPPRILSRNLPQAQGGHSQGGYMETWSITVPLLVQGSSFSDLWSKLDNLKFLMDPGKGDKSIRFDFQDDRYWLGRLSEPIAARPLGVTAIRLPLVFLLADPIAYSNTEITQDYTITSNPDYPDIPAAGVVAGTVRAKPVWRFKNTNAATTNMVKLNNTTTSQILRYEGALAQNRYVRFDTAREMVEYSSNGSTWTARMYEVDEDEKTFAELAPQVSNNITIRGLADGELRVVYRPRYL